MAQYNIPCTRTTGHWIAELRKAYWQSPTDLVFFLGFDRKGSPLRISKILQFYFYGYVQATSGHKSNMELRPLPNYFDDQTPNFPPTPTERWRWNMTNRADCWNGLDLSGIPFSEVQLRRLVENGICVSVRDDGWVDFGESFELGCYTNLSANCPYIVVEAFPLAYEPATESPTGTVPKGLVQRFAWHNSIDTSGIVVGPDAVISAARFEYRAQGSSGWSFVTVPANQTYCDFDTTSVASDVGMEWRAVTTTNGIELASAVRTNGFKPVQVSITDLYPTNGDVFYRSLPTRFRWALSYTLPNGCSGTVTQTSATLQWRVAGTVNFNNILIGGNQTTCTVGGTVFPIGEIEWRIVSNNSSGGTVTSALQSNTSKSVPATLYDVYPTSGKTLYRGFDAAFKWAVRYAIPQGQSGTVTQTSATLQWRVVGGSVNNIEISGNQTTCTVGGTVFPIGEIEWRIISRNSSEGSVVGTWIALTISAITVTADGLYPAHGSRILKQEANRFGWNLSYDATKAPGTIVQTNAVLEWRPAGTSSVTPISIGGSKNFYDFAARYFTAAAIDWRVTLSASNAGRCVSTWATINTQDEISTPQCVSPVGAIVDDKNGIEFIWTHIISTGTAQTAYDLQISTDYGGSYTTLSTAQTADSKFYVPRGRFQQGQLYWRVRTRNGDGAWSAPSPACTFILRRSPETPIVVSVDSTPRPRICWQAAEQAGYHLIILDAFGRVEYDSGECRGAEKQHRVPYPLVDGQKTVQLTIKTMYGIESLPASIKATTTNAPGAAIALQGVSSSCAAGLEWTTSGQYLFFVVLRDGKAIKRVQASPYVDAFSVGAHKYAVQGFFADGNYTQSNDILIDVSVPYSVISAVDAIEWQVLKITDKPLTESDKNAVEIELRHYDGREVPVALIGDAVGGTRSFAYSLNTQAEYDRLKLLAGKTVVYKNYRGSLYIGTMGAASAVIGKRVAVNFEIYLSEFLEGAEYE